MLDIHFLDLDQAILRDSTSYIIIYTFITSMILIDCSTPNDLVSTIGQFTESLTLSAEELLKVCSSFYTTILLILKLF